MKSLINGSAAIAPAIVICARGRSTRRPQCLGFPRPSPKNVLLVVP